MVEARIKLNDQRDTTRNGMGFIVGERWTPDKRTIYVATANHTLHPRTIYAPYTLEEVFVRFYACQGHDEIKAKLLHFSDENDLALLGIGADACVFASRWNANRSPSLAWKIHRFSESPGTGESVWFIGVDRTWEIPAPGIVRRVDDGRITLNIESPKPGSSGAPLIDNNGCIAGMLVSDEIAKTAQAIPIATIRAQIEEWQKPFDGCIGGPLPRPITNDWLLERMNMRFARINTIEILTTAVTQGQWCTVRGWDDRPSYHAHCGDRCPVDSVSWKDIQGFIHKLNEMDSRYDYRLPTKEELVSAWSATPPILSGKARSQREWCLNDYTFSPPLDGIKGYKVLVGRIPDHAADDPGIVTGWLEETRKHKDVGFRLVRISPSSNPNQSSKR
jgi:hypothetical protein